MTTVYWKLEHSPYVNGRYPATNTLATYKNVLVATALGDNKDYFEFKVDNFQQEFINTFSPKDQIIISRQIGSDASWDSSHIMMTGVIRDVPEKTTHAKDEISVKGFNYSETVTKALVFVDGTTGAFDVPQFIQQCLNSVQNYNTNFAVTWDSVNNPTVKTDGSAFPTVNEYAFYKPMSYILEKYSALNFTEDVNYYWFVDKDNKLVWQPTENNPTYSFTQSDNNHLSLGITRDTTGLKNFVIVKAGLDPNNDPIQELYADYSSIAKNGFKYHFLIDENKTAKSLLDMDQSDAGVNDMGDATYPFTPRWSGSSFASYSAYVTGFRVYIKGYANQIGKSFTEQRSNGKLVIDIEFQAGTTPWRIGDVISCDIPSASASQAYQLRIQSAQYTSTVDRFTLKEDKGTL